MGRLLCIVWLLLLGCSGGLSDEQRQQLREAQARQLITKVNEADLISAAFEQGRRIGQMARGSDRKPAQLDSIGRANKVRIHWRELTATDALEIERQVIEAYLSAASAGTPVADNVQRIGSDSLLYTIPVTRYTADSVLEVIGVWSIEMAVRNVVLGMEPK